MTRIIICGVCGRMGRALAELAVARPDVKLVGGVEVPGHPEIGRAIGEGAVAADLASCIDRADVIIDFTTPTASLEHLSLASAAGKPCVLGATGFDGAQRSEVARLAGLVPVVYAPNFSVGMNVLYELSRFAAVLLGADYDAEIVEFHHRGKKDAPSGTARKLGQIVAEASGRKRFVYGREGQTGEKPNDEIGIMSVRTGDVTGEHFVIFGTDGERIELVHKASSRRAFAQGALRAAQFVVGRKPGLYGMSDVLGLSVVGAGPRACP